MTTTDNFGPRCPTCDQQVSLQRSAKHVPFCSERCRLMDLGRWLNEEHALPCEDGGDEAEVDASASQSAVRLPPGWHDA